MQSAQNKNAIQRSRSQEIMIYYANNKIEKPVQNIKMRVAQPR